MHVSSIGVLKIMAIYRITGACRLLGSSEFIAGTPVLTHEARAGDFRARHGPGGAAHPGREDFAPRRDRTAWIGF